MCLALPARIVALPEAGMAIVSLEGVRKTISLALIDDAAIGDYVLIHVGYALHKVSEEEAARTLQLMADSGILAEEIAEMTS
nr:HypC/HybG/HupF family hydrogenase formation chaperone [Rhizobium aegyptiacum]